MNIRTRIAAALHRAAHAIDTGGESFALHFPSKATRFIDTIVASDSTLTRKTRDRAVLEALAFYGTLLQTVAHRGGGTVVFNHTGGKTTSLKRFPTNQ